MSSAIQLTPAEEAQLAQTIEMFEVITQSQPYDYQSLEILREAYFKLGREADLIDTSKRIARAYVQMGQLSSGILEYESILQRYPDDEETRLALEEIENKANGLNRRDDTEVYSMRNQAPHQQGGNHRPAPAEYDDGRNTMHKLFVTGRILNAADFETYWGEQDWSAPPNAPITPFIQVLDEQGVLPIEKSLRMISDKSRLAFLHIEKYDLDIELARSFPAETCRRWCILPLDQMSKSILVATANPFNRQAAAELEAVSKQRFIWFLAPPLELVNTLRKVFRS